jgi:succinate-semialdehyde dehydrogenase/glutarate-semialdehyde dehydrogenase
MSENDTAALPTQLLIGGHARPGSTGEIIEVLDPASGEIYAQVASATVADALSAVDAAAAALDDWAATAPRVRAEILRRAFELMIERLDEFATVIVRENGKTLEDARGEVRYAAEFFRWYSEEAPRLLGTLSTAPSGANKIVVTHKPVGVCVLVTPWNFPAAMATRKIGPALAAGCTVVLKPATATPVTALLMGELLQEAGCPPGVVNVLPSKSAGAVVSAMLDDPRVRKLSFTGSTEVGRVLLANAARSVVNCSMELGGNAPFIVMDDADLDAAIAGALIAKMRNGGEACTAANRFLVHQAVAPEFTRRLAAAMGEYRTGSGLDSETRLGPLVDEATRSKVAELVDGAVAEGAHVVIGGERPNGPGFFYPATVLSNVKPGSQILGQEIFGPVAPVTTFQTDDEAIALANDTEFGLVSYVYTADLARGLRVSERLETGMVGLNRGLVSDPAAPFGGVKQSGVGREGGHEGVLDYMESTYIAVDWSV